MNEKDHKTIGDALYGFALVFAASWPYWIILAIIWIFVAYTPR